tara:strand:+ start:4827 stop:5093 length:267 start_codon:yes stop_codon:yes gene_type:complete
MKKNVKFKVEVIDNSLGKGRKSWGDIDPASGKVTGSYGDKHSAGIHERDSEITEANGYTNIVTLPKGCSPNAYISMRMKEIEKENGEN